MEKDNKSAISELRKSIRDKADKVRAKQAKQVSDSTPTKDKENRKAVA